MRSQQNFRSFVRKVLDGGNAAADAGVVGDDPFLAQRHIQVATNQHSNDVTVTEINAIRVKQQDNEKNACGTYDTGASTQGYFSKYEWAGYEISQVRLTFCLSDRPHSMMKQTFSWGLAAQHTVAICRARSRGS